MEFTIKNTTKELVFGVGFIRRLDSKFKVTREGLAFGVGLQMAYPQIVGGNVTVLSDVIAAAWPGTPSQDVVDRAVDSYAEANDGLKPLFDEVIESLKVSPQTKDTISLIQEEADGL
ncbi:tail assembly chaperone [Streptococcus porci]|uniref:tail assembly chaperone n=1 Tax=Streptococcus porci TaxID=502567 RepID=UPI000406A258|nr:tail assembly chaperone [Streptococcus porci]